MAELLSAIFWSVLAILFARWAINFLRRGDDWGAAMALTATASYVVLAMTVSLR